MWHNGNKQGKVRHQCACLIKSWATGAWNQSAWRQEYNRKKQQWSFISSFSAIANFTTERKKESKFSFWVWVSLLSDSFIWWPGVKWVETVLSCNTDCVKPTEPPRYSHHLLLKWSHFLIGIFQSSVVLLCFWVVLLLVIIWTPGNGWPVVNRGQCGCVRAATL